MRQFFPAKVLLFGEHRVLRGAAALAVPYHGLGASWCFGEGSDQALLKFATFLMREIPAKQIKKDQLEQDMQLGIRLTTTIPFGYGLGSSGTVCAAFWDRYSKVPEQPYDIQSLQQLLARMESFFHGQSSGIDPLVSYMDRPLRIVPQQSPASCTLASGWEKHFFLLDTGLPRQSEPLIRQFTTRYDHDTHWREAVEAQWGSADEQCQEALLRGDFSRLATSFRALSEAQLRLLPFLIPEKLQAHWVGSSYALKVCGAGGGGYMLGWTNNWQQTQVELAGWHLRTF